MTIDLSTDSTLHGILPETVDKSARQHPAAWASAPRPSRKRHQQGFRATRLSAASNSTTCSSRWRCGCPSWRSRRRFNPVAKGWPAVSASCSAACSVAAIDTSEHRAQRHGHPVRGRRRHRRADLIFRCSGGVGLAGEAGPGSDHAADARIRRPAGVAMSGGGRSGPNITVQIATPDLAQLPALGSLHHRPDRARGRARPTRILKR